MKILLVEDDQEFVDLMQTLLTSQHYLVDVAIDAQTGWQLAEWFEYDLIMLDLLLSDGNGIEFCQRRRKSGDRTPILMITAQDSSTDKVLALDAGADDYLVKPIDNQELLARIKALFRRGNPFFGSTIEWQGISLDTNHYHATYKGQPLSLTEKEFALLSLFLQNRHRIFSSNSLSGYIQTVEEIPTKEQDPLPILSLRDKLKQAGSPEDLIEIVYGLGYRLNTPKTSADSEEFAQVSLLTSQIKNKEQENFLKPTPTARKVKAIFHNYKPQYLERVALIEKAVIALKNNSLSNKFREKAIKEAHTLIGSLGIFGFKIASEKCSQLEQVLKSYKQLEPLTIQYLLNLVTWLKQEIEREAEAPSERPPQLPASSWQSPHLLIVDEEVSFTEAIISEANTWGIEAEVAQTLTEARVAIAEHRPDVVVLELHFPNSQENGLDLLSELAKTDPPIPTLVSTAEESLSERLKVAKLGGQGFLHKPASPDQVMEAVTQLLQHNFPAIGKVLIVNEDPEILDLFEHLLTPWGFQLTLLNSPQSFWHTLEQVNPDLIILDIVLSEINGIDLCQVVRQDPKWNDLPILMLSPQRDAQTIERVFAVGADDFVHKPIIGPELIARILNRLERTQMRRRLADTDALTGLANRRKALQGIDRLLRLAKRQEKNLCFVLIDLDHFKQINDRHGHDVGDKVLKKLGHLFKQSFRGEDVVCRWGGEEFVLCLYGMNKKQGTIRISEILEQWYQQKFTGESGQSFQVSFSAGIAEYSSDGVEPQMLYKAADEALYQAKTQGRHRVVEY